MSVMMEDKMQKKTVNMITDNTDYSIIERII